MFASCSRRAATAWEAFGKRWAKRDVGPGGTRQGATRGRGDREEDRQVGPVTRPGTCLFDTQAGRLREALEQRQRDHGYRRRQAAEHDGVVARTRVYLW
jgi:hypothetical protein